MGYTGDCTMTSYVLLCDYFHFVQTITNNTDLQTSEVQITRGMESDIT